jgi:hypothetical protein
MQNQSALGGGAHTSTCIPWYELVKRIFPNSTPTTNNYFMHGQNKCPAAGTAELLQATS